ncbi:MAG: RNA ligase family protein [Paludibacteraceae bacterium]|nr:RNA ligase family protein [Paludibacteraceae bacterium]
MKTKYHRTFHLPYSLTISSDDKRLRDDSQFVRMEVVVTEKMDGENTTVYRAGRAHARSLDGFGKPWQTWLMKNIQGWSYDIPEDWRVCGEDLYARHSIPYVFPSQKYFFQCFSIWNEKNSCLSWDDTVEWCKLLGILHVPVIFRGIYDKDEIMAAFEFHKKKTGRETEGFVVRNTTGFGYNDFWKNVAKFVRSNHVQTDEHWTENWVKNEVSNGAKGW